MSRYATALVTCIFGAALVGGASLVPTPVEAALSKGDKTALREAVVACKAEAKGKRRSSGSRAVNT
jgi:hypothetical protein